MPELKASNLIHRIEDRLEIIRGFSQDDDDESCHVEEKKVWEMALEYFASEAPEPYRSVAEAALETREIHFHRWFA